MSNYLDQFIDDGRLVDVDAILTNARFYIDDAYADGTSIFYEVDVAPTEDEDFEATNIRWKVGSMEIWEVAEDGLSVERVSGSGWFHENSQMGRLLAAITQVPELLDHMESKELTPGMADFLNDIVVTLDTQSEEFTLDDDSTVTSTIQVPTAFGGVHGKTKPAKKAKKAAKKAPAKKAAKSKLNENGLTAAQQKALEALAADSEDIEEFQTRAYAEIDGIEDSDEMQAFVDNAAEYYEEE